MTFLKDALDCCTCRVLKSCHNVDNLFCGYGFRVNLFSLAGFGREIEFNVCIYTAV